MKEPRAEFGFPSHPMHRCKLPQLPAEPGAAMRRAVTRISISAMAVLLLAACGLPWRQEHPVAPTPTETPTPTPSATPTPEPTPSPEGNEAAVEAANEAEQKARQAAKKAAEAAAVAAEASAAARDAARAAAKAVAASKSGRGGTHHAAPRETSRPSASPTPTPEATAPATETSTPEASAIPTAPSEETERDINNLTDKLKSIDRAKLSESDTKNYDIANGLLISARRSASKADYMAASSLVQKAKILIEGIGR